MEKVKGEERGVKETKERRKEGDLINVQHSDYSWNTNKSWGSNAQHGNYS